MNVNLVTHFVGALVFGSVPRLLGTAKAFTKQSFVKLLNGSSPIQLVLVEWQIHLLMLSDARMILIKVNDFIR